MSQSDYAISPHVSGLNQRTEINQIFDSILTQNSGSIPPTVTSAFMMWVDTSNATYYYLKMRNHDNTSWVTLGIYKVATKTYTSYTNDTVKLSDMAIGSGTQSFNGFGGSGFKNHIINGNFDVWQYKDAGLPYPQTSSDYGSDDRWKNHNTGSTKTHSQIVFTDTERALFNASYFSRTVVTSVAGANNYCIKTQAIENVTKLAGKTVTLSFWAKADSYKNIAIELEQTFGTGGSPSTIVSGIGAQLIPLTTTWQKFTKTITIPSILGKTLGTDGVHTTSTYINFWLDAGSSFNSRSANLGQQSGTFDIAQVQLEEGSIATPFEQRPYGLELSLCQRYCCVVDGEHRFDGASSITGNYTVSGMWYFPVHMRSVPTCTVSAQSGQNSSSIAIIASKNERGASLTWEWFNTGTITTRTKSATIIASAEL